MKKKSVRIFVGLRRGRVAMHLRLAEKIRIAMPGADAINISGLLV